MNSQRLLLHLLILCRFSTTKNTIFHTTDGMMMMEEGMELPLTEIREPGTKCFPLKEAAISDSCSCFHDPIAVTAKTACSVHNCENHLSFPRNLHKSFYCSHEQSTVFCTFTFYDSHLFSMDAIFMTLCWWDCRLVVDLQSYAELQTMSRDFRPEGISAILSLWREDKIRKSRYSALENKTEVHKESELHNVSKCKLAVEATA